MKKIIILFLIFCFSLAVIVLYKNNSSPNSAILLLANTRAPKAGALRYKIYAFGILPVGEAVFHAAVPEQFEGRDTYHLSAEASSLELFSRLFRGDVVLDSYVDKERLTPLLFRQRIAVTHKKTVEKEARYDQLSGVMTVEGTRRQIFPDTQDPLSAILNLRRMDFNRLKNFEMNLNTNQKNYLLRGTVEPKQIAFGRKEFKVFVIKGEVRRHGKNPYHSSKITMVLSADAGNIPVLIRVFASGFLINAKLVEVK